MCNTTMGNCFYAHGIIKSLLTTFEETSHLPWIVPFMSQQRMETKNGKGIENYKLEHAPWFFKALQSYCRLLEYVVNCYSLLTVASTS